MTEIVERELRRLDRNFGPWGIHRLKELIVAEANLWDIKRELGLPPIVSRLLIANLPLLLRLTQPKKAELRLVHFKAA